MRSILFLVFIFSLSLSCSAPDQTGRGGKTLDDSLEAKINFSTEKNEESLVSVDGPDSLNVLFTKVVKRNLSILYGSAQTEIPLCLHGNSSKDSIVVDKVTFPEIVTSMPYSTASETSRCLVKDDYLGMVHNHDPMVGPCFPSDPDLESFMLDTKSKIEVIACTYPVITKFNVFVKPQML